MESKSSAEPERGASVSRRRFLERALLVGATAGVAGASSACAPTAALGTQATGSSKLDEVLKRGKLIAGVTLTIPPWGFRDKDGKPAGFDIDIARILAKGLFNDPEKVEFFEQEMDARIPNLATNKVDICIQLITVTAARAQMVEFTIPYFRDGAILLFLANSPYNSYKELIGKKAKISILQNVYAEDMVKMGVPDAEVLQLDTVANALLALAGGRVDAYAGGLDGSYHTVLNPGKYKVSVDGWMPQSYSAAVRPGDQVWLNWVNTCLHEAMTGVAFEDYAASFKQWFGQELPQPTVGFPFEYEPRIKS